MYKAETRLSSRTQLSPKSNQLRKPEVTRRTRLPRLATLQKLDLSYHPPLAHCCRRAARHATHISSFTRARKREKKILSTRDAPALPRPQKTVKNQVLPPPSLARTSPPSPTHARPPLPRQTNHPPNLFLPTHYIRQENAYKQLLFSFLASSPSSSSSWTLVRWLGRS